MDERKEIGTNPELMRRLVSEYYETNTVPLGRYADVVLVQLHNTTAEDIVESRYLDPDHYGVSVVHTYVEQEMWKRFRLQVTNRWLEGRA